MILILENDNSTITCGASYRGRNSIEHPIRHHIAHIQLTTHTCFFCSFISFTMVQSFTEAVALHPVQAAELQENHIIHIIK